MNKFSDKVAVITGGASGIGFGLARKCVKEHMKVVLADIDEGALKKAEKELASADGEVLGVKTDVAQIEEVERLAHETLDRFGAVHLLFNNAGVGLVTLESRPNLWEHSLRDWQWLINVNVLGVVHAVRTFVPIMIKQNTECHIANTASMAGLISGVGEGAYCVTKFGVVAFSEVLYYQLRLQAPFIGVSVLCPGIVKTNIMRSEKHRPPELANPETQYKTPEQAEIEEATLAGAENEFFKYGMSPELYADLVFEAIAKGKFYVYTHREFMPLIKQRAKDVMQGSNPRLLKTLRLSPR